MATVTLRAGEKDPWYGSTIKTVVLANDDQFWVWLEHNDHTGTDDVWWRTAGDIPREIAPIIAREATLESIRLNSLERSDRDAFRLLLANGVARALDGDPMGAQAMLDYSERFVRRRLEEAARRWYLAVSMIGGSLSVLIMIACYALVCAHGTCGANASSCASVWTAPLYAVGMGIVGAAVSLISRTGTFSADPAAGKSLHVLEATARLAVGGVAGFLAFLGVRVGFLSPNFIDHSSLGLMLVSFAAGYSERFISQVTQSLDGLSKPKGSDAPPPPSPAPVQTDPPPAQTDAPPQPQTSSAAPASGSTPAPASAAPTAGSASASGTAAPPPGPAPAPGAPQAAGATGTADPSKAPELKTPS